MRNEVGLRLGSSCKCPICGGEELFVRFTYDNPPSSETRFPLQDGEEYWREIHRCNVCGHYLECFELDQSRLYEEEYVSSTYGDKKAILDKFNHIMAMPVENSDNANRVLYVDNYFRKIRNTNDTKRLLDVGAGLGVFPAGMKRLGWDCTAIDMDRRLVDHYQNNLNIKAYLGEIENLSIDQQYNLITFNKVLEHVRDPITLLNSAKKYISKFGLVYVELPDGEAAEVEGKEREEYLLGHRHVFSFSSYSILFMKAGLQLLIAERIREPSSKFTIRGFARAKV